MLRIIKAVYIKNRVTVKRAYPWSLICGRVVAGLYTIMFSYFAYYYMFKGNVDKSFFEYTNQNDYITYIVLGSAVYTLGVATLMNVGRALVTELREGTLEVLLLSSASRTGYFIGCLIEQLGRSMLEFGAILLVGLIIGAHLFTLLSVQSIFTIIVLILSFFSMSIPLSALMLYTRNTYITQNTLFMLMIMFCGIAFPIEYLPKYLQGISVLFPTTASLDLFRKVVINGSSIAQNYTLLLSTVLCSAIYLAIGVIWYKLIQKKITENVFS